MTIDKFLVLDFPEDGVTYKIQMSAKLENVLTGMYSVQAEIIQPNKEPLKIKLMYSKAKGIVKGSRIASGPPANLSAEVWERHKEYLNAMLLSYLILIVI